MQAADKAEAKRKHDKLNAERGAAGNPWHRGGSAKLTQLMEREGGDDELLTLREDDELLNIDEVCEFVGGKDKPVHPATIYRGVARGDYHQPLHPTPGISRWIKRLLAQDRARIVAGAEGK